jgi:hypothetical protein
MIINNKHEKNIIIHSRQQTTFQFKKKIQIQMSERIKINKQIIEKGEARINI